MSRKRATAGRLLAPLALGTALASPPLQAQDVPAVTTEANGPESHLPMLLAAQYTYVIQHQDAFHAPYSGPLSLDPAGDTQPTNTLGAYLGWAPLASVQLYLDVEKFMGAGVSSATGLAGLTNGDVVREGAAGIKKEFYIARSFARFLLSLGDQYAGVERSQDQIPGAEPQHRLEVKVGRLAVTDDFDQNRYADAARTEFLNWALWANTAWDYAADTRGYTDGIVIGWVNPSWTLRYGIYRMPVQANGQSLVVSLAQARGENLELDLSNAATGTVVRLLAYRNTASMGSYGEALAKAAAGSTLPDIVANDQPGRHKYGFAVNAEQPLADDGNTGIFMRWGWNDGRTESFAFTEAESELSIGGQLAGNSWNRPNDRLALAFASNGLSGPHRAYLAAGGSGFLLDDGRLNYGREQILESYYRFELIWPRNPGPISWQLSPDLQLIRNPGYNRDRGPARFLALRLHVEY
jgi:hypothetical protein